MRSNIKSNNKVPVVVCGNDNVNNLGVVRSLGRHGIPTILLTANYQDIVRYSRYTGKRLNSPDLKESEIKFIDFLLTLGKRMDEKYVIIPTNDAAVLAISKYKAELKEYYLIPVPDYDLIEKLVNKREFYQLLDQLSVPHPKTYFPVDMKELMSICREIEYPYIIKPIYMHRFVPEFERKCFVINSYSDLEQAVNLLKNRENEVIIQDIIPGNNLYSLSTYFNNKSEPLVICGYDKLRQDPPDFGLGTLWRSMWREEPINLSVQTLKGIQYYGIAEPEFKLDPRDNQYKMLEINARTVIPNALPAKCGADITYAAYTDTIGRYVANSVSLQDGILWIDDINDFRTCVKQIIERRLNIKDIANSIRGKRVHSTAAWDDPLPFVFSLFHFVGHYIKKLFYIIRWTKHHR